MNDKLLLGESFQEGGEKIPEQEGSYHWAADLNWTGAFDRFLRAREAGVTKLELDLLAIEAVAFDGNGPGYQLMHAMKSVLEHEGCEGFRGAPRVMLAHLMQLAELPRHARGASDESLFDEGSFDSASAALQPLNISLAPLQDDRTRRAIRVLNMVHELHKAGYQRLRVAPGRLPSGNWRCLILPGGLVRENGWEPKGEDWRAIQQIEFTAEYSTAQEAGFFGWFDAQTDNARQLAAKFVERFAGVASAGEGLDPNYAGWFTWMLGNAEAGRLPAFYGNDPVEVQRDGLPPPPAEPTYGARRTLKNHELCVGDVPEVSDWQSFALTFDPRGWNGYDEFFRMAAERISDTLTSLRARLFIKQRWFKFNDHTQPTEEDLQEIADLLGQIRQRVQLAQQLLR